ncbi:hypothetical protein I7I48_02685 [Histoplasma ohiense]|nr:hypothetical protein I7I48_02685 [Histoplasma ohiense (nom. inval.)]
MNYTFGLVWFGPSPFLGVISSGTRNMHGTKDQIFPQSHSQISSSWSHIVFIKSVALHDLYYNSSLRSYFIYKLSVLIPFCPILQNGIKQDHDLPYIDWQR